MHLRLTNEDVVKAIREYVREQHPHLRQGELTIHNLVENHPHAERAHMYVKESR